MHGSFLVFIFFIISTTAQAIECEQLKTDEHIRNFIHNSKTSNPLLRKRISTLLEVSPCEGDVCEKKNKVKRSNKTQHLHLLQLKNNQRYYFVKGPDAPQCLVQRGERQYYCTKCGWSSNEQCRAFNTDEVSTTIQGTNIDRMDFQLLDHPDFISTCADVPGQADYLQITTVRKKDAKSTSDYDKIIGFYDKEKEVPITLNYFNQDTLHKVYRFFPKYYLQIKGQWMATAVRIRTVQGNERQYVFETKIRVLKDADQKNALYFNPENDPNLKNASFRKIFQTD